MCFLLLRSRSLPLSSLPPTHPCLFLAVSFLMQPLHSSIWRHGSSVSRCCRPGSVARWTPKPRVACCASQVAAAMPCAVRVSSPRCRLTPCASSGCPAAGQKLHDDLSDQVEALRHTDLRFDRELLTLSNSMERRDARSEPCFVEDEMCSVACASSTGSSTGDRE